MYLVYSLADPARGVNPAMPHPHILVICSAIANTAASLFEAACGHDKNILKRPKI